MRDQRKSFYIQHLNVLVAAMPIAWFGTFLRTANDEIVPLLELFSYVQLFAGMNRSLA